MLTERMLEMNERSDGFDPTFSGQKTMAVDGRRIPLSIIQLTAGAMDKSSAAKSACTDHLKTLQCSNGEACGNIHFKSVYVRGEDGKPVWLSAGRFDITQGLIHFASIPIKDKMGWVCRDWRTNRASCDKGNRCTFLHLLKIEEVAPQIVLRKPPKPTSAVAQPSAIAQPVKPLQVVAEKEDNRFPSLPGSANATPLKSDSKMQSPSFASAATAQPQDVQAPAADSFSLVKPPFTPTTNKTPPTERVPTVKLVTEPPVAPAIPDMPQTSPDDPIVAARILTLLRQNPHANAANASSRESIRSLVLFLKTQADRLDAVSLARQADSAHADLLVTLLAQAIDAVARGFPLSNGAPHAAALWQHLLGNLILRDNLVTSIIARSYKLEEIRTIVQLTYLVSLQIRSGTEHMSKNLLNCAHVWGLGSIIRGARLAHERFPNDWAREAERFVKDPEISSAGTQLRIIQDFINVHLHADVAAVLDSFEGSLCSSKDGRAHLLYRTIMQHRPTLQDPTLFSELCVWDSLLFGIEQRTSRQLMKETAIEDCYLVGSGEINVLPHVCRILAPGGAKDDIWLQVRIDPAVNLCFPQWQPSLFIGQYVSVLCQEDSEKTFRFVISSVDSYVLTIRKMPSEPPPPIDHWFMNNFRVRVQIDFNSWHLTTLLDARRRPQAISFVKQLRDGSLRPGNSALVPAAARNDVTQNMRLDKQQTEAVLNILARPRLAILWGPPGTGKTHTIASAIAGIVKHKLGRVLACATSNYAVNVLAQRLISSGIPVLRAFTNSTSPRDVYNSVFRDLLQHSNGIINPRTKARISPDRIELDSAFERVTQDDLEKYPVICITTAHTQWMQQIRTDFEFVFVDECSQATEAESLMPVTFVEEKCTICLSGDPHQLGPSIVSLIADHLGLGSSLMHRHFDVCGRSPVSSTLLINCYRCHPSILEMFNTLFYNNSLDSLRNAKAQHHHVPIACSLVRNQQYPVLFVDIPSAAPEQQIFSALDFYSGHHTGQQRGMYENEREARAVEHILSVLLSENRFTKDEAAEKIGVITPYRQQVLRIRGLLAANDVTRDVLIGTVDQYQGQEREIIIVSTVRGTKETYPGSDFTLSFVGDRRKTNVAISRAERMLIIVGDASEIAKNDPPVWGAIVATAKEHNGLIQLDRRIVDHTLPASNFASAPRGPVDARHFTFDAFTNPTNEPWKPSGGGPDLTFATSDDGSRLSQLRNGSELHPPSRGQLARPGSASADGLNPNSSPFQIKGRAQAQAGNGSSVW